MPRTRKFRGGLLRMLSLNGLKRSGGETASKKAVNMQSSSSAASAPVLLPLPPTLGSEAGRDSSGSSGNSKGDGGVNIQNIQVIVRCRPLSEEEMKSNSAVVISCNELKGEVSTIQNDTDKHIDKTYVFDKVFGLASEQADLFNQAISPIVGEVLEGYNCTIFTYGQTGTGKTYTMEGGINVENGEFPRDAGVIPRVVHKIFETLEEQKAEYSMKVSFLELYHDEITDLLAPDEFHFADDKSKKSLALMEDEEGSVFVSGLQEEMVFYPDEVFNILDKGTTKRCIAETLLNKQSSQSHSIFSITIQIKEYTQVGEEIKWGKLNLVDLAGSESVSKSGASEGRTRETGEVNKGLHTLSCVINALADKSSSIPYSDSKLTTLLRDSLGGKTKTLLIATISPSIFCMEDTLSTLDYAIQTKNIKNRPEVNQKMMKSVLIRDLYSEIDRIKKEVHAARENCIYVPKDRYLQEETEKKALAEKTVKLEFDLESMDKKLTGLQELYSSQQQQNNELKAKLGDSQKKMEENENALFELQEKYKQAHSTIKEKEYLISNLLKSEKLLVDHAYEMRKELENVAVDVSALFSKIEHKDKIEDGNKVLVQKFQTHLTEHLDILHKIVSKSVIQVEKQLKEMEERMQLFVSVRTEVAKEIHERVEIVEANYGSRIKILNSVAGELGENSQSIFEKLSSHVSLHSYAFENAFKVIASEAEQLLNGLQNSIYIQEDKLVDFARHQREGHFRTAEAARLISKATTGFFHTLDMHVSRLSKIFKETHDVQEKQLSELEMKFEECAANEEKQLLEKVAELIASSNSRKKQLVRTTIDSFRQGALERTDNFGKEMSSTDESTSSVKEQLTAYVEKIEQQCHEDTGAVESSRCSLENGFRDCMTKARTCSQQWNDAQNSMITLECGNRAAMDSIIREGAETNQLLRKKLSSAAKITLENAGNANNNIIASADRSLNPNHDACASIDSMILLSREELRELESRHHHKIGEITNDAEKFLLKEFIVDESSCLTPRKRLLNLPSSTSVDDLRTPPFEELLESFRQLKSDTEFDNGAVNHVSGVHDSQLQKMRDPIVLTAVH